ncbi:MAG: L-histidine N(alpha)-methyltransferase [Terriglobales bacterium]
MIARAPIALPAFAADVEEGLLSRPKSLPCKLFYDSVGSVLFEEITRLPEYYLTRTELEILQANASEIADAAGSAITVVELGSGTAVKTCTLLDGISCRQMRVPYFPVDISPAALKQARHRVEEQCSRVSVHPVVADFSEGFSFLRKVPGRKLVLYLGSSIGNFDPQPAAQMLSEIRQQLDPGDSLLLGTDLAKARSILVPAYDDAQDITAQFNKNILRRLNRELGANFNLEFFRHIALWNPAQSRMEIYLESLRPQTVNLGMLLLQVPFANGERIHTENSYKYSLPMVKDLLETAGFNLAHTWFDDCKWFALHLAHV